MSRSGKIARLPVTVRDQLNQRLQDGQNGRDILSWLNDLPEVKSIITGQFGGRAVTDCNLTDWRQGGYRDWQIHQTALAEIRRASTEGEELAKAGDNHLTDKLALWLVGRYVLATRHLTDKRHTRKAWKLLREICHDLTILRRGEHESEWLRLGQERLKLMERKRDRKRRSTRSAPAKPPPLRLNSEEEERRLCLIFGIDPDTHPILGKCNPSEDTGLPETVPSAHETALENFEKKRL